MICYCVHLVFFVFVYAVKENSLIVVVHVSFTCAHTHAPLFAVFQHVSFLCQIYKLIDW